MRDRRAPDRDGGFSLIELLVVVAIIAILSAMVAPPIGQYFRNYRIREAQNQIATAIQRARGQAISKNVNNGVSFVIESPTRYWIHIEDDQSATRLRVRQKLDFGTPDPGQSTAGELPKSVRFATSAAECPTTTTDTVGGPALAPNGGWFRFDRLGAWFGCATASCAPAELPSTSAPPSLLMTNQADPGAGSLICVFEEATGLSRALLVSPGGRLRTTK